MNELKQNLMALDEEIRVLNGKREELLEGTNLKKCGKCLQYKDIEEFPKRSGSSYCKDCFRQYQSERRKERGKK